MMLLSSLPISTIGLLLIVGALVLHFALRALIVNRTRSGSPVWAILFAAGGLAFGLVAFNGLQQNVKAYHDDPSCALGFAGSVQATPASYGACHLERVTVTGTSVYYGRRSTHRTLTLRRPDGSQTDVELAGPTAFKMFSAARNKTATLAIAQLYQDRVVELMSDAGIAQTQTHPQMQERSITLMAIIAGAIGVIVSLGVVVRSLF